MLESKIEPSAASHRIPSNPSMADDQQGEEAPQDTSCKLPALDSLPPHFVAFLRDNGVPEDAYNLPYIYRFLRYVNLLSLRALQAQKIPD